MKIKYVKQDCWFGLFWKTTIQISPTLAKVTTWYLCLIPCLPIIWTTKRLIPIDDIVNDF